MDDVKFETQLASAQIVAQYIFLEFVWIVTSFGKSKLFRSKN